MKPDNQTKECRVMPDHNKLIARIKAGHMISPEVLKSAVVDLVAENERLRGVLVPLRDTEWEKQEPNDRDQLPDDWQAYIEEMEAFCSHYDHEARAALEGQIND